MPSGSYQFLGEGGFRCFEEANRKVSVDEESSGCDVCVTVQCRSEDLVALFVLFGDFPVVFVITCLACSHRRVS